FGRAAYRCGHVLIPGCGHLDRRRTGCGRRRNTVSQKTRNELMASKKAAQGRLKLSSVLDLNEASTLHGRLMELRGSDIKIDASEVERLGVPCAQVLVAGAHAWHSDKKSFAVEKAS